jgi:aminoglycoside phosphotransferase (APT) family kinase protein
MNTRSTIYYWKCDRPATLHGVGRRNQNSEESVLSVIRPYLEAQFKGLRALRTANSSGNHRTYLMEHDGVTSFVRVEDGPEGDAHLAMESLVVTEVGKTGVPVPKVLFTDATRTQIPYALQVIEYFPISDLNRHYKEGKLSLLSVMSSIGRAIASWQNVPVQGFGPFDPVQTKAKGVLCGYHANYETYFCLHLDRHLNYLLQDGFLSVREVKELSAGIDEYDGWDGMKSVLVHKDLALWNILGTPEGIQAYIDWDDAIAGDPCDDLSLLACFHSADAVQAAIEGYACVRELPRDFTRRFWLHLLRNMIVKAVIRCGAGYFDSSGSAFLMSPGQDGSAFRKYTYDKLQLAYRGLRESLPIDAL